MVLLCNTLWEEFSIIVFSLKHDLFITNGLRAHDGFTQPTFYKRFDRFNLLIRQNTLKKQWSAVTSLEEQLLGLN